MLLLDIDSRPRTSEVLALPALHVRKRALVVHLLTHLAVVRVHVSHLLPPWFPYSPWRVYLP